MFSKNDVASKVSFLPGFCSVPFGKCGIFIEDGGLELLNGELEWRTGTIIYIIIFYNFSHFVDARREMSLCCVVLYT